MLALDEGVAALKAAAIAVAHAECACICSLTPVYGPVGRLAPCQYLRRYSQQRRSAVPPEYTNLLIPEDRLREHGVDAFGAANNLSYVQVHRGAEQHVGVVAWKTSR
jgi:hypothetical protein